MIFRAAMDSLDSVCRVDNQIIEAMQAHMNVSCAEARKRMAELFNLAGPAPELMDRCPPSTPEG